MHSPRGNPPLHEHHEIPCEQLQRLRSEERFVGYFATREFQRDPYKTVSQMYTSIIATRRIRVPYHTAILDTNILDKSRVDILHLAYTVIKGFLRPA